MSFQPVLPLSGYAGWAFLKRTLADQQAHFAGSAEMKRDAAYFADNIASVETADDLVGDRRLLKVALGAYGLSDDIDNKAFLRKVLSDGTLDTGDLANRLSDKSYYRMASAFSFDLGTPSTVLSGFAEETLALYSQRQFEAAVGAQNNSYRLALNAERELGELAGKSSGENTKWYTVMGNEPLRKVFETALGLPSSVGQLDVDRQLEIFKSRAASIFGDSSVSQFADSDKMDSLVRRFILRDEIANVARPQSAASIALQILGG